MISAALIVMASAVLAQQTGPGNEAPGVVDPKAETHDKQYRENRLRNGETAAAIEKAKEERLQAAIEHTKQDFKRIQIIRNEMVDYLVAKAPLNYKLISDEAGEINKRAIRINTFLMPSPTSEKEKEKAGPTEFESAEMTDVLVKLCNLIYSFTQNPVINTLNTVDTQQAAKAYRDLQGIIELSDNIKRSADSLKKTSK
jgi:hypothetical protein